MYSFLNYTLSCAYSRNTGPIQTKSLLVFMVNLCVCISGGQKQRIAIARALLKVSATTWFHCLSTSEKKKHTSGHTSNLHITFVIHIPGNSARKSIDCLHPYLIDHSNHSPLKCFKMTSGAKSSTPVSAFLSMCNTICVFFPQNPKILLLDEATR